LQAIQHEIHSNFIDLVKRSRGARLTGPEKTLFSGEYWTAVKARELGLVDRFGDTRSYLRERFGDKVSMPVIGGRKSWLSRVVPGVAASGFPESTGFTDEFVSSLETRAIWARLGF
jgi:ClpP class serine protease